MLLMAGLVSCGPKTPQEAQLRKLIEIMEEQAEAGEIADFMESVADDFGGQDSRLNRDELKKLLRIQILQNTQVSAVVTGVDVELFDSRATASMNALLTGGGRGWLPERGQLFKISSGWRFEDGDWYLIHANWEPIIGQ